MDESMRALMSRLEELVRNVHQYVGARYVPNFIDEPWNNTTRYEALDVVDNGSGTSYIAKKPVPQGTPLSDREYWFVYGSTSGAIINLQNQIDAIVANVDTLQDNVADINTKYSIHKYFWLIISDSYAITPSAEDNWCTKLVNKLGLSSEEYLIVPEDGMGFGNRGFNAALYTASSLIDTDKPVRIVCCGGFNDATFLLTHTYSELATEIRTFISNANTLYNNPEIFIGFISYELNSIMQSRNNENAFALALIAYRSAPTYDAIYLNDVEYALRNYQLLDSSGFHPTTNGAIVIASAVFNSIILGCAQNAQVSYTMHNHMTPKSGSYSAGTIIEYFSNNMCGLNISNFRINNASFSYTGAYLELLEFSDVHGMFSGSDVFTFYGHANVHLNNTWTECMVRFKLNNNVLSMVLIGQGTGSIDDMYLNGDALIPSDYSFMDAYPI